MEEHKAKVDPTTVEAIELAIAALNDDLEKDDVTAEKLKSGIQNVTEAAMKLGEAIYKASQEAEGEAEPDMKGADEGGDAGGCVRTSAALTGCAGLRTAETRTAAERFTAFPRQ
jgi:hypothetical protein